MQSKTERHCSAFRSKDSNAAATFERECKFPGVFDGNGFCEPEKARVNVREGMYARSVREIYLETQRRNAATVRGVTLENGDAAYIRSASYHSRRHRNWNGIDSVLQRDAIVGV